MRVTQASVSFSVLLVALTLPGVQTQVPDAPMHAMPEGAGAVVLPLVPVTGATAIDFGPGVGGNDLYVTTLTGDILRVALLWTAAGPVVNGVTTFATDFGSPLGIAFDGGVAYVADSHPNPATGRTDGRVTRIDADGTQAAIVDGLPNGRHNTNHLRFGPDGRLYITNGNPNDNGIDGGDADVLPYSGAILSIDPAVTTPSNPAVLEWTDESGPIAPEDVTGHPANADFAAAVEVLAYGFRNVFGVAFGPTGIAYTAMNGADVPASQDSLYRITPGTDYGYPFCFNEGLPGAVGVDIEVVASPVFPGHDCSAVPPATALLGWHTCATGIDFPTPGPFGFQDQGPPAWASSVFVAECVAFQPDDVASQSLDEGLGAHTTHSTSHKVVRVGLDDTGHAVAVQDVLTGFAVLTDLRFGPDGAMYVADAGMVYRVSAAGADPSAPLPTVEDLMPVLPGGLGLPDAPAVAIQAAGLSFVPPVVTVPAGTTVQWDGVLIGHTVDTADSLAQSLAAEGNDPGNSDADPDTFSHGLPQGSSVTHRFDVPGTYYYFCEPHAGAGMVGVVVVLGTDVPASSSLVVAYDQAALGQDPLAGGSAMARLLDGLPLWTAAGLTA
jgi:glucose/arabinose dehydrogenase/plastocyanin